MVSHMMVMIAKITTGTARNEMASHTTMFRPPNTRRSTISRPDMTADRDMNSINASRPMSDNIDITAEMRLRLLMLTTSAVPLYQAFMPSDRVVDITASLSSAPSATPRTVRA